MPKLTYFPLIMDRWIGGTQELTFEQKGFYIDLLIWMYQTGNGIKNAEHVARILKCDPRTSRRLLAKLRPKFYERSGELRHKLVTELIKNGCKIRGLNGYVDRDVEATKTHLDPDPEYISNKILDTKIAKPVPIRPTKKQGNSYQSRQKWEAEIQAEAREKKLEARPGESWQAFADRVRTTRGTIQ